MAEKVKEKKKGMNPAFKRAWVKALRSGKYRQGIEALRIGDRFCCLGVACDIAAKKGFGRWEMDCFRTFKTKTGEKEVAWNLLPSTLADYFGLDNTDPIIYGKSLATRNDRGRSFKQIANLIEKHL